MSIKVTGKTGGCTLTTVENGFADESTVYNLNSFHFHAPSEHLIDGEQPDMAVHFVHSTPAGRFAVVGLLFTATTTAPPNPWIDSIWKNGLPETPFNTSDLSKVFQSGGSVTAQAKIFENFVVPMQNLAYSLKDAEYVAYRGSLTTPPCTESVRWHVYTTPIQIPPSQLRAFRAAMGMIASPYSTARPPLPLNSRVLYTNARVVPTQRTARNEEYSAVLSTFLTIGLVTMLVAFWVALRSRNRRMAAPVPKRRDDDVPELSTVGSSDGDR
eukprot:TRINITY_DN14434_c0_g1_i2.p1 TRINITY_DN14434_c0_g1~~TRINITY_DN14434_c0_g1_i2.p1  ORF type:complete len:270 (+),score=32.45 TRINITY_DN14434_c0_g1_i2:60-869(+)